VQARIIAHKTEYIGLLERFQLLRRRNGNQGRIAPIVAPVPVDPFVPFKEIQLAAFPALVQRAGEMAAVLIGFDLLENFREFAAGPLRVLSQGTCGGSGQLYKRARFFFHHFTLVTCIDEAGIFSRAGFGCNPRRCAASYSTVEPGADSLAKRETARRWSGASGFEKR
jgi:hypothetical protein